MKCAEPISIDDLKRISQKGDRYFFNPDTTRFFHSRYPEYGYKVDKEAYFITSERMDPHDARDIGHGMITHPRTYSLRRMNLETGRVFTVEKYGHTSREAARAGLKKILEDKTSDTCVYDVGL